MALQKLTKSLPFSQGVDTKTDARLALKPSRVENMVFRGGTLQKRYGTTQLANAKDTGGTFSTGEALAAYDSNLFRLDSGTAWTLGPAFNKWVKLPGGQNYCTVGAHRIIRNTRTQYDFDQATANGITVFAWIDSGLHIAVYDETTGTFYQTGSTAVGASNAYLVRCVALSGNIVVFLGSTDGGLWSYCIFTATPENAPSGAKIRSDLYTSGTGYTLDALVVGSSIIVAYESGALGGFVTLVSCTSTGTLNGSPAPTAFAVAATNNNLQHVAIGIDGSNNIYVVGCDAILHTLKYFVVNTSFGTVLAIQTIATPTVNYGRCTLLQTSSTQVTAIWAGPGLAMGKSVLATIGATALITLPGTWSFTLCSSAFVFNGTNVVAVTSGIRGAGGSPTNLQPTGWVVDFVGNVVAKFLPGTCGSTSNSNIMRAGRAVTIGSTTYFLAPERVRLVYSSLGNGTPYDISPIGLTRIGLTPTTANTLPINRLGDCLYIGGGCPRIYDGQQIAEQGFGHFPEALTVALATGGALSAGSYQWKAVYSWVNQRGEIQRSAASPPVTATATLNQQATITIPTCPANLRDANGLGAVQIEIYRTTVNGTLFYRASTPTLTTGAVFNDMTVATVSWVDTVSDATLQLGELLYTTGGVFDNFAAPAYSAACVHKDRLFAVGLEDPYTCWFSSKRVAGEMVRFSPNWVLRVPAAAGPLVACASMDDKLILFTASTFFVVLGDGPDLLGNGAFSDPQPVVGADSGALSPSSVVEFPEGILFQSAKGITLLDRGLNTSYFGADVETYGLNTIRTAILRAEVEQVWFFTDTGSDTGAGATCLVWDYHYNQWSVLTSYGAQDACYYQGKLTRVRSDGVVFQEQPGTFLDSGSPYSSVVETAWLKLAGGVQGFQRIWRAILVGLYGSDFTLTWDAAYDYVTTYAAGNTIVFVGNGVFTVGSVFQIRRHMAQQKCEAIKFRFTDSAIGGTGQGMSLTALDLEFGIKPGGYKLPATQST